jgi:hypothetical protein
VTAIPRSAFDGVSDKLTRPLAAVAARRFKVDLSVAVCKTLCASLLILLICSECLGNLPSLWMPVRVALALLAWVLIVTAGIRFLLPAIRRWSLSRAAMHIEQDRPHLHERLSSAIELSAQTDPAMAGSRGLIAQLFREAETEAASVRASEIVSTEPIVRWALLLAPVLIAWMTLAAVPATSQATLGGLYHILLPWRSLPMFLSRIAVTPGDVTLIQGDSLDVTVHLSYQAGDVRSATLVRKSDDTHSQSDPMEQIDGRDYRLHIDNLQQSFTYRVQTPRGNSGWFTATVHPRPRILSLDVHCDPPAYTGISPSTLLGSDGAIEAVVGTHATIMIHTALPIAIDKSAILLDGAGAAATPLPLRVTDPTKTDYAANLLVKSSGEYHIQLINEFGVGNDDQPHRVVAIPDQPPTIVITSPQAETMVSPDDVVAVKFIARDDFGISKIEALVQVDDQPLQTIPLNYKTDDKREVIGSPLMLSVPEIVKTAGNEKIQNIFYQLKVTDNRDPDPQVTLSNRQSLKIDRHAWESYQDKTDRRAADELRDAIGRAIAQLDQERAQVQHTADEDPRHLLQEGHRRDLGSASTQLPNTSRQLQRAVDAARDSAVAEVAARVQTINEKSIEPAAEHTSEANLNADKGVERQAAAQQAVKEIAQAKADLQKILDSQAIDKQLRQALATRDLAEAAQKQKQAADLMKAPQQVPPHDQAAARQQRQAMADQQKANDKLRQAMDLTGDQAQPLRDPQAQQTAQQLQDLIHKVDETQANQQKVAAQTQKQQAVEQVQKQASEIAQQQEALNHEIARAAEQNKQAMQQANANPPSADQQKAIVQSLNRDQLQQAQEQMRQSATQLHQAAQQLQNQVRANNPNLNDQQRQTLQHDADQTQEARNRDDAAQHAAEALKQKPDDAGAIADARHAATEIEQQAEATKPKNDDARDALHAAQEHARAAEKAAEKAAQNATDAPANADDPNQAQQARAEAAAELKKAGSALAEAAKKNADADRAAIVAAQQKAAQAAADQADQLSDKQNALAKTAGDQARQLAQVQNAPRADQVAQQQSDLTEQTKNAKKNAEQLVAQAQQANNTDVEARAKKAEADLAAAQEHAAQAAEAQHQAAQHQQDAANADNAQQAKAAQQDADHELAQASQQQQQAAAELAKAEGDLRQANAQTANAQTPAQAAQEAAQAQQEAMNQQNPQAAQQAANALARAAQAMAKATQAMGKAAPGNQPGQPKDGPPTPSEASMKPSPTPGRTADAKAGITMMALPIELPASLLDMGISADEWAVLPPLVKKDLLNAAQQSGPPEYRQMMREYFAKVAKMQETPR